MRRLLVVSDHGPSISFSGGLVLIDQIAFLSQSSHIDFAIFNSHPLPYQMNVPEDSNVFIYGKIGERFPIIKQKRIKEIFHIIWKVSVMRPWVFYASKKMKQILKNEYDAIFFISQGYLLPWMFNNSKAWKTPTVLQYWDPISWWGDQHNFTENDHSQMKHQSVILETSVSKIVVPAPGMADDIIDRSSIPESRTICLFPTAKISSVIPKYPKEYLDFCANFGITIIFGGALYALKEILLLIEAFEILCWSINGKTVGLAIFTNEREIAENKNVMRFDKVEPEIFSNALKFADFGVLPYPMDNPTLTTQSFPSKMATYSLYAKNLILLAPKNSSIQKFAELSNIDQIAQFSPSASALAILLRDNLTDEILLKEQNIALRVAHEKYFSIEAFNQVMTVVFGESEIIRGYSEKIILVSPKKDLIFFLNKSGRFVAKLSGGLSLRFIYRTSIRLIKKVLLKNIKLFHLEKLIFPLRKFLGIVIGKVRYESRKFLG